MEVSDCARLCLPSLGQSLSRARCYFQLLLFSVSCLRFFSRTVFCFFV